MRSRNRVTYVIRQTALAEKYTSELDETKVDSPRSNRKPTICVPFMVLRGPRVFGYFDHNCRWASAIWQPCPSYRGNPLNADQLASISTVETRQHVRTGRVSSNTFWTSQYQLGGTASKGFSKRLLSRLPRFYWSLKRRPLADICYTSSAPTPSTVPLQYFIVGNRQSYGSYIGSIQLVGANYSRFRVLILKRSRLTLPHARKTNSTGHSDLGRKGNLFSTILTIAGTGDNLRSKRYYGSSTVLDSSSSSGSSRCGVPTNF